MACEPLTPYLEHHPRSLGWDEPRFAFLTRLLGASAY